MIHSEQFAQFLRCCKEQRVQSIHLADAFLLVNPASGDFGSVIIEFDRCNYLLTSKYRLHELDGEEIDEFSVKEFKLFSALEEDGLTESDIYKTLSAQKHSIEFITEMVDEDGYFNGMEWKYDDGYLFFTVSCPEIAVFAAYDEELKYFGYPHQFGEDYDSPSDSRGYYELFPNA